MEEEFLTELRSLVAAMLDNLTPRYTPLSQGARWQLLALAAPAAAAALVLFCAAALAVRLRRRRTEAGRLAEYTGMLAEAERLLCPGGASLGEGGFVQRCAALGRRIDRHTNRRNNSALVARLSRLVAGETRMSGEQAALCFCCALTADAWLLSLPRYLFFKELLSARERRLFRTGVQQLASYLDFVPAAWRGSFVRAGFHRRENYDGSGYPEGLAGRDIPVLARIIRAAGDYTALTERMTHSHIIPLSPRAAVREMEKSGDLYDRRVVAIIARLVL